MDYKIVVTHSEWNWKKFKNEPVRIVVVDQYTGEIEGVAYRDKNTRNWSSSQLIEPGDFLYRSFIDHLSVANALINQLNPVEKEPEPVPVKKSRKK